MHGFYVHGSLNCALLLRDTCCLIGHRWVGERRRGQLPRRFAFAHMMESFNAHLLGLPHNHDASADKRTSTPLASWLLWAR